MGGGEGAGAGDGEADVVMPSRGSFQPQQQVGQGRLMYLAEEGERDVPGFPAGPAQVIAGGPQRSRQPVEFVEDLGGRSDSDKQPHRLTGGHSGVE
jgi:hypothetical protein